MKMERKMYNPLTKKYYRIKEKTTSYIKNNKIKSLWGLNKKITW